MIPELRSMVLIGIGPARFLSPSDLSLAAQGVRDQLSEDVWIVLAEVDRALHGLEANPYDQGLN